MLRKVTSLLTILTGLSLLVIAGELVILTCVRAPAQGLAGVSPQASGLPAQSVEPGMPPVSQPLYLPGRSGPVETGRQANWPAALLALIRKTSLRPEAALGQWLQSGEYDTRTGPTGDRPVPSEGKAFAYAVASASLLALAALLARALADRRRQEAQAAEAAALAGSAPARQASRWEPGSPRYLPKLELRHAPEHLLRVMAQRIAPQRVGSGLYRISHHRLWAAIESAVPEGPEVGWERIRLVPT